MAFDLILSISLQFFLCCSNITSRQIRIPFANSKPIRQATIIMNIPNQVGIILIGIKKGQAILPAL
jgi:hypothetical protein